MFDERRISSVSVPNAGYVPRLPREAVLDLASSTSPAEPDGTSVS